MGKCTSRHLFWYDLLERIRAVFDSVSKVILNCFGFALLRSVIGLDIPRHLLNQGLTKAKHLVTRVFPPGGGHPLIWAIRGRAGQGMVFGLSALNRVYNFMRTCPKQGLNLS